MGWGVGVCLAPLCYDVNLGPDEHARKKDEGEEYEEREDEEEEEEEDEEEENL